MDETALPPLLGIIGYPIAGNPMQFAMEQALQAAGLDWRFVSFEVAPPQLGDALRGLRALGFRGASIAPPFGHAVLTHISRRTTTSHTTAWCDALVRDDDGELEAHHLLAEALIAEIGPDKLAQATVGLLGNSAKTLALIRALVPHGVRGVWLGDAAREALIDGADATWEGVEVWTEPPEEPLDLLLRGTLGEAGMGDGEPEHAAWFDETQLELIAERGIVVDFAVKASTSPLLRLAVQHGCRGISAIDLLVGRASLAFQLWTGATADPTGLRDAFEEYLEI
jgi:shikimate dehydrogenase